MQKTIGMTAFMLILGISAGSGVAEESAFPGWEMMRVIRQDGMPAIMEAGDITGNGRDELIIVNSRQSRLDIYQWLTAAEREKEIARDPERPNELPMAPEFLKTELPLERIPRAVGIADVTGDEKVELIILTMPPNRIQIYKHTAEGWSHHASYDLLPGSIGRQIRPMLVEKRGGQVEVLIDFDEGIQRLRLADGEQASWLSPREREGRIGWTRADLNGDGHADVVEWTRQASRSIRWYESIAGQLQPAQVLYDENIRQIAVLTPGEDRQAELLVLSGTQEGILRRFVLGEGEDGPLGSRQALPLTGGGRAIWSGIQLGEDRAIVVSDPEQPRLLVSKLGDHGWTGSEPFPSVSRVEAMAAPGGAPGTLLLRTRDASDLHVSHWKNGRLTYPRPMPEHETVNDRKILALGSVGPVAWWAQKVDKDLVLSVWAEDQKQPVKTRFPGIGEKADQVVWIGGQRLLILEQYARQPKLVVLEDDAVKTSEPSHLQRVQINDFRLIRLGQTQQLARLTDGVLQWIGDDLHPTDQVMLPEGAALSAFAAINEQEAWGLETATNRIHRLRLGEAGLWAVDSSYELRGASSLLLDPVLGLLAIGEDRVIRLSPGTPDMLELVESIDGRVGRVSGERESTIHRLFTTDVTGNGRDDLVMIDDNRRQITVLGWTATKLEPIIDWQVFEDSTYPYGGEGGPMGGSQEPRNLVALDFEGDGARDLVMICHDRLLIYLGRAEQTDAAKERE